MIFSFETINPYLLVRLFIAAIFISISSLAQNMPLSDEHAWIDQLTLTGGLPEKLLSTRSVIFHDFQLSAKELKEAQEYFQRTGVDAVSYFELDMLMAGKDVTRSFSEYLLKREIQNLIFIEKKANSYRLTVTSFNGKENVVDPKQNAWSVTSSAYLETVKSLYRTASNQLKRTNLLINDFAETDAMINPIIGKRNEFFAMDLKVDPLAVPKTGDTTIDNMLEEIFKNNYPLKYKLTEPGVSEKDLRKQGLLYVMEVIYCRDVAAKELLGYDITKAESAIVSVTYSNGQSQLKNIPSSTMVYKVYFKHIDSGNVFLGTKWDADLTLDQALLNQLRAFKIEFKIN